MNEKHEIHLRESALEREQHDRARAARTAATTAKHGPPPRFSGDGDAFWFTLPNPDNGPPPTFSGDGEAFRKTRRGGVVWLGPT